MMRWCSHGRTMEEAKKRRSFQAFLVQDRQDLRSWKLSSCQQSFMLSQSSSLGLGKSAIPHNVRESDIARQDETTNVTPTRVQEEWQHASIMESQEITTVQNTNSWYYSLTTRTTSMVELAMILRLTCVQRGQAAVKHNRIVVGGLLGRKRQTGGQEMRQHISACEVEGTMCALRRR